MLDAKTHKTILIQILKEIYSTTSIGPLLGFKGGTAAYLFYELNRFSVDLDFDLLNENQAPIVFEEIGNLLNPFGKIKEKRHKRLTLFYILSYAEKAQNVKVEISTRDFGSRYEIKNYLGIPMQVMIQEDMAAHKLVALLERKNAAHRDLFDIWFFLKNNWPIHQEIVERRTGMKFSEYLKKCIGFIEKINERNILSGMGELLDEKMKQWVKSHLKKDLLFLLHLKLEMESD